MTLLLSTLVAGGCAEGASDDTGETHGVDTGRSVRDASRNFDALAPTDAGSSDTGVSPDQAASDGTSTDGSSTVDTAPRVDLGPGMTAANGTLLISEVCDADLPGARFIELFNASTSAVSLDGWNLKLYFNGSSFSMDVALSAVSLASGGTYVVARDNSGTDGFDGVFGVAADQYAGEIDINGNDAVILSNPSSLTVDIYGVVTVDGIGQAWEYTGQVAKRNTNITRGEVSYISGQWTVQAAANCLPHARQ